MKKRGQWSRFIALGLLAALLATMGLYSFYQNVTAAQFSMRRLHMSDNRAGQAGVSYELSFSGQSSGTVSSIRLQLCENDPFPGQACTVPAGLHFENANLVSQTGMTGFSVSSASTSNEIILTRTPGATITGVSTYTFSGITNPTTVATIYGRLETFASANATGPSHDAAGLAIAILPGDVSIRSEVPPYLLFCIGQTIQPYDCATASGNYIDFGILSSDKTATGQTKMLVATNAEFGYTIRAQGTTLLSGINAIDPLTSPDVSRQGKSQFGINLRANSTPQTGQDPSGSGVGAAAPGYNTPNQYKFVSGDVLASYNHPDNYRMYTASYVVNVSKQQQPGIYVTTLTYIALASF